MTVMSEDATLIEQLQVKVKELSDSLESLWYSFTKKTGLGSNEIQGSKMQSVNFKTGVSGWELTPDGNLEANDGNFRGTITATTGTIGAWSINATSIYTGTEDHSGYTANAGDITFYSDGADASIHAFNWYIDTAGNFHSRAVDISGVSITAIPNDTATDISLLEKSHNLVFSVTDADTIAWATGTIVLSNGRTFTIDAGNTGNMAALTYIYLDTAVSSTVLQTTTTYSTAMGANKALIGVAQNNTVTASFIPYGAGQALIDGANIGALSIVAGNIAASTITSGKLSVSQLSAISADLGAITAGSVSVVNGGNTIGLTPAGTNAIFSGTTGSPEFKVTPAGALTATSATITGAVTITSGSGIAN